MPSPASHDLLLKGDLVLEDRVVRDGAVGIDAGRIAAVYEADAELDRRSLVDFSGRYILPGVVDTHVHAGSFETESIETTTASAAAGGVTTIVDMPYDRTEPVMGRVRLDQKVGEVEDGAIVDVGLFGTMPKEGDTDVLEQLVAGGVCAFKFSLFEYDPRRFPRIPDGALVDAFETLSATQVPIVLHNELQEVIEHRDGQISGSDREADPRLHGWVHPPVSETAASVKALDFAHWTGARLHLAHCTHPHTFRLIDLYRQMGAQVSGETCAHYLMLNEDQVAGLGPIAKVNPPVRDREAADGLWGSLEAGEIASVSSDHAPWPLELKQRGMLDAAAGIPGLESLLPGVVTTGSSRGVELVDLIGLLTWRPADIFGLGDRKGRLEIGKDADVVVFDTRTPATFRAADLSSGAKWSPFDGWTFDGRVEATYLRGKPVYAGGSVVGSAGDGEWLRRRG